jgi:soluble lytic murein transglycosylase-like protein
MDNSVFTSQFQTIIYSAMMKMMENMVDSLGISDETSADKTATTSTSSETGATISAGPVAANGLGGVPSAAYSSSGYPSDGKFSDLIMKASQKYGVNPSLIGAVIRAESNFNPSAVSSCGAEGLMQLMPGTAKSLGVSDSLNPAENIDGGVKFLRNLLDRYGGDMQKAVAAYNAGPGAVDQYGGIPPYTETQTYVNRVLNYFKTSSGWEA